MSDRNSHHSGTCPNDNINLFGNRPRLFDGSIRRSASMGNLTGSNDSGLYDEKSDHEDGYISEDIESGRQRRKGVLRTEEGHSWFLPGLHNSAQEPSSTREDDVTTEEELNTRVEALIKNFYSQMQKRKSVEALSPKEDDMMTEEELNDRVGAFIEKFHSQMQKRKPVDEPWWKVLDFAALKQSPVSFFNTEEPETAVTRWEKARRRAAKIESDDEAHHKRDGSSTRKVALDHIFVVGNFVLELPSAVFDQLSSLHKPQYALLSMLTSITAILKPNGPKPRPPKSSSNKSSLPAQDEVEIEIAHFCMGSRSPRLKLVIGVDSISRKTNNNNNMNKSTSDAKSRVSFRSQILHLHLLSLLQICLQIPALPMLPCLLLVILSSY
ncbi:hypothetical protein LWI28_002376 [Acer negundo]|uniref:Uncharacterized protein n=1 Tax=Acer negundo TaxID=4023 RepID=A0AAD5ITB9_ACENE|nr:hypothetical protein LWI28_002376 [Acer negundo]